MIRRAFTLTEMLVTMGVCATLSTIAVTTLIGLYRVQTSIHEQADSRWSLRRLDRQIREDFAGGHDLVLDRRDADQGVQKLRLRTRMNEVVQYEFHDHQVIRRVSRENKVSQRDAFRLAPGAAISVMLVQNDDNDQPPYVTLAVARLMADSRSKAMWMIKVPVPSLNSGSE